MEEADFRNTRFTQGVNFGRSKFEKTAKFEMASFDKQSDFSGTCFVDQAFFSLAVFAEEVFFVRTSFGRDTHFIGARFLNGASFSPLFSSDAWVDFSKCSFKGTILFGPFIIGPKESIPLFRDTRVYFCQVILDPPDCITFLFPDFKKCHLLDTDLRKVLITGATWPEIPSRLAQYATDLFGLKSAKISDLLRKHVRGRIGVYDELCLPREYPGYPWERIERLYRELKQNFEDRRDYERAGDFHFGEKEMRRYNRKTNPGLRLWLTLYWLFSGYGERYFRPLVWAAILFVISTTGYMALGLRFRLEQGGTILALTSLWDWLLASNYSLRVMTFLRPEDLIPIGCARFINTAQSLLGPLLLGLFALALRQRLRR
jgi:uncharacterized protein YjbI with pentapeptide repeats